MGIKVFLQTSTQKSYIIFIQKEMTLFKDIFTTFFNSKYREVVEVYNIILP